MKRVALEKSQLTLAEVAEMARGEPVILTRQGKPFAAIQDLSGTDWESVSLANNPQFIALIEKSRRSYEETGGIGVEQLRKELKLKASRSRKGSKGAK